MKIKFINHACFIIESSEKRIMCDPWFEGSVFDNGWSLMYEGPPPRAEEYDYVWISHEHPDHFRPSLFCESKISNDKKIILQSRPKDKKLRDWFSNKNYEVMEIPQNEDLHIGDSFTLSGDLNYDFDSWVCFKSNNKTILNLNDCISFKTETEIKALKNKIGDVDVLLAQFSFANWTGNKGDLKTPQKAKDVVLTNLKKIFDIIRPNYIIPFASFVYFSHEENSYLNRNSIQVNDFVNYFKDENIIVMKPGDEWRLSDLWCKNDENICFWSTQAKELDKKMHTKTNVFSYDRLEQSFEEMKAKLCSRNDMKAFAEKVGQLKSSTIYVTDLDMCVSYNILESFQQIDTLKEECDVHMSSESLHNVMKNAWGFGTLMINGRFQANYKSFSNFVSQTRLYYMNNIGKSFPASIRVKDIVNSPSLINKLI